LILKESDRLRDLLNKDDFGLFLESKREARKQYRQIYWVAAPILLILPMRVVFEDEFVFYTGALTIIIIQTAIFVFFGYTRQPLKITWKIWFGKKSIVPVPTNYQDVKDTVEQYIERSNNYYDPTSNTEEKRAMRGKLITSTKPIYDMLNEEDKRLAIRFLKGRLIRALMRIFWIIIIGIGIGYFSEIIFPDNNLVLMMLIMIFILVLIKQFVDHPIEQILLKKDPWVSFCETKSIKLQSEDYYEIKLAIEDHINTQQDYYSR
jgi:hypothetical protein